MSLSTNMVSGLSSGFDWRTMIDQLIAVEHRRVDLVVNQKTDYESKLEILQGINTKLLSFKTQSETLANSDAFNVFTSSLTTNSTTYSSSDFFSLSTSTSASPGIHTIEMDSSSKVAQARKISSRSFSSYDTALGLTDGAEFVINGRAIKLEDTDDLLDIRDKINNQNTGTNATGVTASVLTVSTNDYRLVLTSDNTGENAFSILDASGDSVDILQNSVAKPGLGFIDSTTPTIKNTTSDGAESDRFSSSDVAVGILLGLDSAQTGTNITVGTTSTLDINLATESLTTIASNIDALSGVSASVKSITEDGTTKYYIDISGTTNFGDVNNVLQTLGILVGGQSDVAEVHLSDKANTEGASAVDSATTFDNITGYTASTTDTITISGTKNDGTTVTATTFNIYDGSYKDLDALLTQIESSFGLSGTSATIDANGKIQITDSSAGDSQLSISLVANNEGGGALDLGTLTATTQGYDMELRAGQDAVIKIDGTTITSSSNAIDDVISGVTLNLKTVESGKSVDLTISRDYDTIKSSVQGLLDTYNDVLMDINEQFYYDEETQTAGLLQGDATLSSIKSNLQNIVVSAITGLPSTINALSLIGINSLIDLSDHKNDGKLSIDNDDFMDALEDNFNGVRRIFVTEGTTTDGNVEYIYNTKDTVAGTYDINITQAADQSQETGNVVLTNGIGAGDVEILTITQGGKTAAITLDGDAGENGSTIDNIVNAINSELETEYTQSIMGNIKNTLSDGTTAITSSTLWSAVYSDGGTAGLVTGNDYELSFTGHKKNGVAVTGSYTISDADVDTVQGLLSAIEAAYENEVSAAINTYGYLVITDNTNGNSNLDITITEPGSLNFGDVTTSNLVGSVRNTIGAAPGGNAITSATKWKAGADGIYGSTIILNDTFTFFGYTADGSAVEGSYQVTDINNDTVAGLLTAIKDAYETAYDSDVDAIIQDGRIVIKDGTSNSTLGIEIIEPSGKGVDFGTISGGVTGRYAVDVTASKDGSDHLVLTGDDYGSSAGFTVNQGRASANTDYNKIIYTNTANTTDASNGDIYISSSTTWSDIYGAGTIETGDTITLSGTDRSGNALDPSGVSLIYTIDVSADTVDTLLTRIEDVFADLNNIDPTDVEARIEQGKIVIEDKDTPTGTSQISLTLAYVDVGGAASGSLVLGTIDQSTERDLDLGIVNGTRSGLDVVGTINGESATGAGQTLTGDAPAAGGTTSVEGLSIKYTGDTTGAQGSVKITMGVAELFNRVLHDITNAADGYLDFRLESMADRIDDLDDNIERMEVRLDSKMEMLISRFVAMELALAKIQNMSSWLTGQVNAVSRGWV